MSLQIDKDKLAESISDFVDMLVENPETNGLVLNCEDCDFKKGCDDCIAQNCQWCKLKKGCNVCSSSNCDNCGGGPAKDTVLLVLDRVLCSLTGSGLDDLGVLERWEVDRIIREETIV